MMAPTTDWGKSIRDAVFMAIVVGIIAGLEALDPAVFGTYEPVGAAVIGLLVAKANRHLRKPVIKR